MKNIKWKLKGFGKGLNPEKVNNELTRINKEHGSLTPEIVVSCAKEKKSILHPFFEWNNDKAAEKYRLQQARNLINNITVTIIHHGEPVDVGVYEIITIGDGARTYKNIGEMTVADVQQVRSNTIADLEHLSAKLSLYDEFVNARMHLSKAIISLKKKKK